MSICLLRVFFNLYFYWKKYTQKWLESKFFFFFFLPEFAWCCQRPTKNLWNNTTMHSWLNGHFIGKIYYKVGGKLSGLSLQVFEITTLFILNFLTCKWYTPYLNIKPKPSNLICLSSLVTGKNLGRPGAMEKTEIVLEHYSATA